MKEEKEGKMTIEHTSVMLDRCIALLSPAIENSSSPIIVDATLGLGGHAYALLEKYPNLKIISKYNFLISKLKDIDLEIFTAMSILESCAF